MTDGRATPYRVYKQPRGTMPSHLSREQYGIIWFRWLWAHEGWRFQ